MDSRFPVWNFKSLTARPRMTKISRFARNDSVGRSFTRLCVVMAGFARRFLDDGFPVFRSSLIHRFTANEKISRSARNDGAGRGYPGLHVLSPKKAAKPPPFPSI